jgi:hypothetical protein
MTSRASKCNPIVSKNSSLQFLVTKILHAAGTSKFKDFFFFLELLNEIIKNNTVSEIKIGT